MCVCTCVYACIYVYIFEKVKKKRIIKINHMSDQKECNTF